MRVVRRAPFLDRFASVLFLESKEGGRETFGALSLPPFMKLGNNFLLINLPQSSAGASELGGGVLPTQLQRTSQVAINTARKTNKLR